MGARKQTADRAAELASRIESAPDPFTAANTAFHRMKSIFESSRPDPVEDGAEPFGEVVLLSDEAADALAADDEPSDAELADFEQQLQFLGGAEALTGGVAAKIAALEDLLDGDVGPALFQQFGEALVALRDHLKDIGASTDELDELEVDLSDPAEPDARA